MVLTIHDPDGLALRRGIRAAVALPVGLAIALFVADDATGAIFTVFGTIGLLINADFAGSAMQRLGSYLATGLAGTVVLVLGWAVSPTTVTAVALTVVVAFALSFANLLRGPIAVGTPAVLLIFVVAVSVVGTPTNLRSYLLGWWLAVIVCTVTALVLLPRNHRQDFRATLAEVFTSAARAVSSRSAGSGADHPEEAYAAFAAAVQDLDDRYGGQPFRTMGLTPRDQAMYLLVAMVNSARLLLEPPRAGEPTAVDPEMAARTQLVGAIVAGLDDLSRAMTDPTHAPSAAALDSARQELTRELEARVLAHGLAGTPAAQIAAEITAEHELRMVALAVEQMIEVARIANRVAVEDLPGLPPVPERSGMLSVLSHLTLRSPWMRNAMRSALGLGLAVWVVQITGAEKGFWVLLAVISILRFDAVGTRRFAVQAVVGTIAGVAAASIVISAVGGAEWVLWTTMPVLVFLAAWSAVAISYPVGQAAFSALVLTVMAIVSWPTRLDLGLIRIEDILLGAGVALVVGFLMWPRGAVGYLRQRLAVALSDGSANLAGAVTSLITAPAPGSLEALRRTAIESAELAGETYDLSLMQRGPSEDMRPYTRLTVTSYLLLAASRVIVDLGRTTPGIADQTGLAAALEMARDASSRHWADLATALTSSDATTVPASGPDAPDLSTASVATAEQARAFIVTVWVIDWTRHLAHSTTGPVVDRRGLA